MPNHVTPDKQLFELNVEFELQFIIPHHGYVIIAFYCKTRKGGGGLRRSFYCWTFRDDDAESF